MSAVFESTPAPGLALDMAPVWLARAGELTVSIAATGDEVEQALELRHQVFTREYGTATGADDRDIFDPHCRHLIAVDRSVGRVIGTYRLLEPQAAARIGCLYTESEFWLTRLDGIRPLMVELGRSCVHPDYRNGAAIRLLWAGIGQFLAQHPYRYLIGCASVPATDGGMMAANLYRQLALTHLAGEELRVWPRKRLPVEEFAHAPSITPPPLVKGYLRAGAVLLGEPHVDADFGSIDFPMLLSLDSTERRYLRRFVPALAPQIVA